MIFLGGTTANNHWREELIADFVRLGFPAETFFNPIVEHWTPEARKSERRAKKEANILFIYIGDPQDEKQLLSPFSLVEATMGLYDNPRTTAVVLDPTGLAGRPLKLVTEMTAIFNERFPEGNIFSTLEAGKEWLRKMLEKK